MIAQAAGTVDDLDLAETRPASAPAETGSGMIRAMRARHAVWAPIMAAVVETVGRGTPIHWATIRARLGKDPGGERFAALAARLPAQAQDRLWKRVREQRAKAGRVT